MPIRPNQTTGSLIRRISEIKRNTKLKNALLSDIDQKFCSGQILRIYI